MPWNVQLYHGEKAFPDGFKIVGQKHLDLNSSFSSPWRLCMSERCSELTRLVAGGKRGEYGKISRSNKYIVVIDFSFFFFSICSSSILRTVLVFSR